MKNILIIIFVFGFATVQAQEVINLPLNKEDASIQWENGEMDFHSKTWDTRVVTNVSKPSMSVYLADNPNGAAVVICPGGGLYAHSIDSEGIWVAQALNKKGITAFVLKYRLVPTGEDGTVEIMTDGFQVAQKAGKMLPLSVSDGLTAIEYVRSNSEAFNIDPNRIGIMGFSAGGAVVMGTAYDAEAKNRPDFIAPVYYWEDVQKIQEVPEDAGPAFILCATDDPLGLAPASAELYLSWIKAGKSAELHMYSKGGHGFGMRPMELPVASWIDRFTDWMEGEGLMGNE